MADSSDDEMGEDGNRYDDAEDDVEIDYHQSSSHNVGGGTEMMGFGGQFVGHHHNFGGAVDPPVDPPAARVAPVGGGGGARGKPEAMAAALAASNIPEVKEKLEAEKHHTAVDVVAVAVPGDGDFDVQATPVPEAKPPPKKKQKKAPRKSPASTKKTPKASSSKKESDLAVDLNLNAPSIDDAIAPISPAEYQNLIHLMEHFCKVPLLAEFSRPVTLLHPELMAVYSKIVTHPVDLGRVCRKIGRREYKNTREVQLDMWRIFANCVKYHSHPSNKEGVPSFVSIALHLREFFNNLCQEYMLPSDTPKQALTVKGGSAQTRYLRETYATREEDRKKRLIVSGLTCMSVGCMKRSANKVREFVRNRGCVDKLDTEPLFPHPVDASARSMDEDDLKDLKLVMQKLDDFADRLGTYAENNAEYTIEQFDNELKACYTTDVFENNSSLKFRVRNRVNRFLGKILVPINEANCRGVTQSSIWGCMAAAIWARESSKKPFWPALVLGILAPDDQREDWHWALTSRNEQRLPEALRTQLTAGKRKAEQALKRQSLGQADPQSFFLVEFLGTHEFIWVRETDIVESFEPEDDPNVNLQNSKKKRSVGRTPSVVGSKKYQAAIEEAGWALEEFEQQLQDACGDVGEADDGEDGNYSYTVLCVSDDEADDVYDDDEELTALEIEEANELIATRGLLDFSATGRKNAKKRAQLLKKQKQEAEKKQKLEKAKKAKAEQLSKKKKKTTGAKQKEKEDKKEQRDLEKRRKKRMREREKALKSSAKKTTNKRKRLSAAEDKARSDGGSLSLDKRARAIAIVKGYLTRMAKDQEYRSLGLQGIMSIPAAQVDSSGLLGMALAFRAAAGELTMPEESGDQEQPKPWDAIAVNDAMTPEQRVEMLRKQAELLEAEIRRVKSETATRLRLAEQAEITQKEMEKETYNAETVARVNPFKKRKKVVGSGGKGTDESPAEKSNQTKDDKDEEMKDAEDGDDASVGLGPTHVSFTPLKDQSRDGDSDDE